MPVSIHLFLRFVLVSLLAVGALSIFHLLEIEPYFRESAEDGLVEYSTLLSGLLEHRISSSAEGEINSQLLVATQELEQILKAGRTPSVPASIFGVAKTTTDLHVYVTNARGIVMYDSHSPGNVGLDFSRWNDVARVMQGAYGARTTIVDDTSRNSMTLYVAAPVRLRGGLVGVVSTGKALSTVQLLMRKEYLAIAVAGAIVVLLIALLTFLVSRSIAKPLTSLRQYALDLSEGRSSPVPQLPFDELKSLAKAIDHLRRSLDGRALIQKTLQQFTHELKSPLTAVSSAAELMQDPLPDEARLRFSKIIINQTRRALGLVERQLSLSKLEANPVATLDRISVNDLVADLVEVFSETASIRQVSLQAKPFPDRDLAWVLANRESLSIVFANVIQNALDFTLPGGSVTVSVSAVDRILEVMVVDSGVGIPEYALGRLFEGYYSSERPDSHEKGTGLGLKISREILSHIGGTISLENGVPNGCRATIRLPRA